MLEPKVLDLMDALRKSMHEVRANGGFIDGLGHAHGARPDVGTSQACSTRAPCRTRTLSLLASCIPSERPSRTIYGSRRRVGVRRWRPFAEWW